jgi:hypothetical protein
MVFLRAPRKAPQLDDGPHAGRTDTRHHASSVVVTDIDMPFLSMVTFMVKWALASIPAFLILGAIFLALRLLIILIIAAIVRGGHP